MKQKKKKKIQGTWFAFVAINNIWCLTRKSMERLWKDDRRKLEGKGRTAVASERPESCYVHKRPHNPIWQAIF